MSFGAARVCLTLREVGELIGMPEGHRIQAVTALADGFLGITIVCDNDGSAPALPRFNIGQPAQVMDLNWYRKLISPDAVVERSVLRSVPRYETARPEGYIPARSPVQPGPAENWPRFPGEGLPVTGDPDGGSQHGGSQRGDPGDENSQNQHSQNLHTGGPR